jgi:hypothetical protein
MAANRQDGLAQLFNLANNAAAFRAAGSGLPSGQRYFNPLGQVYNNQNVTGGIYAPGDYGPGPDAPTRQPDLPPMVPIQQAPAPRGPGFGARIINALPYVADVLSGPTVAEGVGNAITRRNIQQYNMAQNQLLQYEMARKAQEEQAILQDAGGGYGSQVGALEAIKNSIVPLQKREGERQQDVKAGRDAFLGGELLRDYFNTPQAPQAAQQQPQAPGYGVQNVGGGVKIEVPQGGYRPGQPLAAGTNASGVDNRLLDIVNNLNISPSELKDIRDSLSEEQKNNLDRALEYAKLGETTRSNKANESTARTNASANVTSAGASALNARTGQARLGLDARELDAKIQQGYFTKPTNYGEANAAAGILKDQADTLSKELGTLQKAKGTVSKAKAARIESLQLE